MEVSIAEFARRVGKSERAVHLRLERGTLHREPSGKIDLEKGLEEWHQNTRPNGEDGGYNKARTAHVFWKAELARLELEKRRRQVLDTLDCGQWWTTVYRVVRKARLARKPTRELAAVADMVEVVSMLDTAIRAKLHDLVDRARKETRKFATAESHEREDRPDPSNYRQCLERKEYFMAKLKELEAGLKREQYLYEHEVNKAITDALSSFKDRLLRIPQRVAAQVSATEDPAEIDKILADAFKEAVDGLPEDITEGLTIVEIEEDGTDEGK